MSLRALNDIVRTAQPLELWLIGKASLPSLDEKRDPNADLRRMAEMSADEPAKPRPPPKPTFTFT